MKSFIALGCVALILSACGRYDLSTAQELKVEIKGTEAAYCVLSSYNNRYALRAPGVALIERDKRDLTVDCQDNYSDRRRVKTLEPFIGLGYWNYPDSVAMDFTEIENGNLQNGYRTKNGELTEKSFSHPLVDVYETEDGIQDGIILEEGDVITPFEIPTHTNRPIERSEYTETFIRDNSVINENFVRPVPRKKPMSILNDAPQNTGFTPNDFEGDSSVQRRSHPVPKYK
jgi:hypothetical protein